MLNLNQETKIGIKASFIFIQSQEKNTCIEDLISQLKVDEISAEVIYKVLSKIGIDKLNEIYDDQNKLNITFFERLGHIINLAIRYISCERFGYEISIKEAKDAISNDLQTKRFVDLVAKSSAIIETKVSFDQEYSEDIYSEGNIRDVPVPQNYEFIAQNPCYRWEDIAITSIEEHSLPQEGVSSYRFMRENYLL